MMQTNGPRTLSRWGIRINHPWRWRVHHVWGVSWLSIFTMRAIRRRGIGVVRRWIGTRRRICTTERRISRRVGLLSWRVLGCIVRRHDYKGRRNRLGADKLRYIDLETLCAFSST